MLLPSRCWCYQQTCSERKRTQNPSSIDKSKPADASKMSRLAVGSRDRFGKQLDLISGHVSARVGLAKVCSSAPGEKAAAPARALGSVHQSPGTDQANPCASPLPCTSRSFQSSTFPADSTGKLLLSVEIHGSVLGILLEVGVFISLMTRGKFKCRLPEVLKQYRQSLMGQTPSSINLTIPIHPV